jgi:two-component system nitrogen regulation response regulator GlnG
VRQLENLANWLTVMAPAQTVEIKDCRPISCRAARR